MDLLYGNVKKVYFNYLSAAFGSALISSIYSTVDMAAVDSIKGQPGRPRWRLCRPFGTLFTVLAFSWGLAGLCFWARQRGAETNSRKTSGLLPR